MSKSACGALMLAAVVLSTVPARGQVIRKMEFALGARQNELKIEIAYHDPADIDARLKGSRLLPIRLSITNVSSNPVPLDYADLRLNLNGNQPLTPVNAAAVADEIRRMNGRFPSLLGFLAGQSSAFHRTGLDKMRLPDGRIEPGRKKDGFVFFMRPDEPNAPPFNGLIWLETPHYSPQALETKSITVKTAPKPTASQRIRQMWETITSGEFPYNKSYALLIGIGKYKNLRPLSSPTLDVKKMQNFLAAQGFDEIMTVEDESVTLDMFQYPQKYFSTKIEADDRFLFYYSGHGVSSIEAGRPRGYLPLVNEVAKGHSNSVAMDKLVAWMKGLRTKQLMVIMDACFSGLAVEGIETHGVDRQLLNSFASGPARYLMMAGTEDQESLADQKWNGSLFTEMIIRGVQAAKFEDRTSDKIIATHALYGWVRPAVSTEALKVNRQLTPLLKDLADVSKGEFVFFRQ